MNTLIIIVLLVIAAETTYMAAQSARKITYRKYTNPIFVDTSVLIDGRIISVAQSGFVTGTLLVPRSVLGELQFLADQGDHEKRVRARHGLDVVKELQELPQATVKIFPDSNTAEEGVDNRLLKLAKKYRGSICTIDYNLNKVAQAEDIQVLNVNDLAMNLRMAYLPGERIMLELTQKGNDSHQAVGHLADGTMVVVEQASSHINQTVEIEFIRSLQTAAGKMMFARIVGAQQQPKPTKVVKPIGTKPQQNQPRQQQPAREQRGRNNQQAPQTAQAVVNKQNNRQQQPKNPNGQRQSRRPRNHEDSLVELANKIGE